MGFAVFHAEKITASGASLGYHIDRVEGKEHTFSNADPQRKHLNYSWDDNPGCSKPVHQALADRIQEGYTGETAIRKDAVKGLSLMLTGSHEDMKVIEKEPEKFNAWLKANFKFVKDEFGKENIVRFVVHRDEKTPHIHAIVVPLQDGRLTAKKVLGNRIEMSQRQDRYAQAMEPFSLSRGIKGSKAIHNSEGWYVGRQHAASEAVLSDLPELTIKDRFNPSSYKEKVSGRMQSIVRGKTDLEIQLERNQQQLKTLQKQVNSLQEEVIKGVEEIKLHKKVLLPFVKFYLGKPLKNKEKELLEMNGNGYLKSEAAHLKTQQEIERNTQAENENKRPQGIERKEEEDLIKKKGMRL
jgi:hypothetical protein